jgi:hypothetical protein
VSVPTVERGLEEMVFWFTAIVGDNPLIFSTSGFFNPPKNCRAYDDKLSKYRR